MALRVGVGVGPFRVSGSVGRRPTKAELEEQHQFNVVTTVVIVLCAGPWASVHALDGRWGVTAIVAGVLFIIASVATLSVLPVGQFVGTTWLLLGLYETGYFSLWEGSGEWIMQIPPDSIGSFDGFALAVLAFLLGVLLLAVIGGVPLAVAFLVATVVTRKGDSFRQDLMSRHTRASRARSAGAQRPRARRR